MKHLLPALVIFLATSPAWAVSLAVNNPGFEDDSAPPGCFTLLTPNQWTLVDSNGIIDGGADSIGVIDPTDTTNFPAGAPEGYNVALIFLSDNIGGGPVSLTQVITAELEANTTYTLSVEVGNIASGIGPPPCNIYGFFDLDGFPGYRVQLLAGGELLEEDDNLLAGAIPEGAFATSVMSFTTCQDHPQLGEQLEIRLTNLNQIDTLEDPGIEVDFDDVRLDAEPAQDGDSDGVPDACDSCMNTIPGATVDAIGCPPVIAGDFDYDGDVAADDVGRFVDCFSGPRISHIAGCEEMDFDTDGDVDAIDFATVQRCYTGQDVPGDPDCAG